MYEKHIEQLRAAKHDHGKLINEALDAAIALMRAAEPKDETAEREHCRAAILAIVNNPIHATADMMAERAAARAEVEAKYSAEIKNLQRGYEYQRQLADDADEAVGNMQDELEEARNWIRDLEARAVARSEDMVSAYESGKRDAIRDLGKPADERKEWKHCEHAVETVWDKHDSGEEPVFDDWEILVRQQRAVARAEGFTAGQASLQPHFEDLTRSRDAEITAANARIEELEDALNESHEYRCCGEYASGSGRHGDECAETRLAALREAAERAHEEVGYGGLSREAYDGLHAAIEASKR